MNKNFRERIDLKVAMSGATKHTAFEKDDVIDQTPIQDAIALPVGQMPEHQSSKNGLISTFLQPIARLVFKILRPVLRPIGYRIRTFLLDEMRNEIQTMRNEISAGNTRTLESTERLGRTIFAELEQTASRLVAIEKLSLRNLQRYAINGTRDEILVRTEVGYVLCSAADYAVLPILLEAGDLERGTRLLIQRLIRPGNCFVDIGANLGLHTLAAAHAMQGNGRIIAFEPFEQTKELLEKSIWINGFAKMTDVRQLAVSDKVGTRTFYLGKTSGHHSLFPLEQTTVDAIPSVEVQTITLDQAIEKNVGVDLIKIDAEGSELDIIKGATGILQSNRDIALVVEFGMSHVKRIGHTSQTWMSVFTDLGFEYRGIKTDTGRLTHISLEDLEKADSTNIFLARPQSGAWEMVRRTQ